MLTKENAPKGTWHDLVRMDAAVMHGVLVDFLYVRDDDRLPSIMMYGDDFYHLYYDQVAAYGGVSVRAMPQSRASRETGVDGDQMPPERAFGSLRTKTAT